MNSHSDGRLRLEILLYEALEGFSAPILAASRGGHGAGGDLRFRLAAGQSDASPQTLPPAPDPGLGQARPSR